jgi:hypothetical protein
MKTRERRDFVSAASAPTDRAVDLIAYRRNRRLDARHRVLLLSAA